MRDIIVGLRNGKIPDSFGIGRGNLLDYDSSSYYVREEYIENVGFALFNMNLARELKSIIKDDKVLEICAGTGFISYALQKAGVDIIATDNYSWINEGRLNKKPYIEVENIDGLEAINKYGKDVKWVLVSWPPYQEPIAYEAVKLLHKINPDATMIFLGEDWGGNTANDDFFEFTEEIMEEETERCNEYYERFFGIYDSLTFRKYKESGDTNEEKNCD